MTSPTSDRDASRIRADREELAERIARLVPEDGRLEPQPGVFLARVSTPRTPVHGILEPSFCVIAQGSKHILLGTKDHRYDPAHFLISTLGVPAIGEVFDATRKKPYLSFQLMLDPAVVTSVTIELAVARNRTSGAPVEAVDVSPLDANQLNATLRLVRLIDTPSEYRALAPLVVREIVYRLLMGTQGDRMRHLATRRGESHRITRAVGTLKARFDKPLRIDNLARELGMSASGFHAHFKSVTAMSPLRFQKHLRLQEARRLMLSEHLDAAQAGFRVGYEDASHFSREYKRHFGEPPMRDVERMRLIASS